MFALATLVSTPVKQEKWHPAQKIGFALDSAVSIILATAGILSLTQCQLGQWQFSVIGYENSVFLLSLSAFLLCKDGIFIIVLSRVNKHWFHYVQLEQKALAQDQDDAILSDDRIDKNISNIGRQRQNVEEYWADNPAKKPAIAIAAH